MASLPETLQLSNRLADLAERAGEAARRYRRGSIESIREYLSAGELLAEARGECRRGEWGAVLSRAGIESRTAQRMVQAWRMARQVGADAEAIHEKGGVQAFVASVLADMQAALHGAADGLDGEAPGGVEALPEPDGAAEKPVFKTGIESPAPHDNAVEADAAAVKRVLDRERAPARNDTAAIPFDDGLTEAQRKRQAKRDRGECIDCPRPTDGWHVRCPACRERIARADKRRREDAKLGKVLGKRIREAARSGKGIRLSAADVAGLVDGERARFSERLANLVPKGRG